LIFKNCIILKRKTNYENHFNQFRPAGGHHIAWRKAQVGRHDLFPMILLLLLRTGIQEKDGQHEPDPGQWHEVINFF
jgi:hypothetical protein